VTAATRLLDRLAGVKATGASRWVALCPGHTDRRPSLSVRELDDRRVLVHCFAGCETADVLAAVGLTLADLFDRPVAHCVPPSKSRPPAVDALQSMLTEAAVAQLVAEDLAAGRTPGAADLARLSLAVQRLAETVRACNGR
jgi:hypothetical protein